MSLLNFVILKKNVCFHQCKSVTFFSKYLKLLFFSDDVTKFARVDKYINEYHDLLFTDKTKL